MRVLYILHSTQATSGATKALLGLIMQLVSEGVTPLFIVPGKDGVYDILIKNNFDTYVIPFKMSIYPNRRSFSDKTFFIPKLICRTIINIFALIKIIRLAKMLHPDIIHTNTSVVNLGRMAAKSLNIPHIQHIREYSKYGNNDIYFYYFPSWRYVHKSMKKNNICNICITKDIQKHHELTNSTNTSVVYDGVHDVMQKMPNKEKEPFFLYAGRIEYIKGLDILLHAYNTYKENVNHSYILYVAGEIADELFYNEITHFIDSHQLKDHVRFLGNVDKIEELMQKAAALIIPSRFEGFGFCMPEAMFNGCLCIGNYVAGTKEQLDNGVECVKETIALSYSTEKELTDCLIKVHKSNDNDWNSIKEYAFKTVNTLYTNEKSAKTILQIYHNIIKS